MRQAALAYTDLELDMEEGKRGSRQARLQEILQRITGAEAALVVNNNAAAVLLGLAALAEGREVIVSRGEAVEIGGGFRIPDVLRQSGAALVEVGSTNRTYASDYADAISDRRRGRCCGCTPPTSESRASPTPPQRRSLAELGQATRHTRPLRPRLRLPSELRAVRPLPRAHAPRGGGRRRRPTWSSSQAISSWAARRQASSWAGRSWCACSPATPWPALSASTR